MCITRCPCCQDTLGQYLGCEWVDAQSLPSDFLLSHGLGPTRLLCPRGSPRKNTGVGFHALLQGIFPTQGLNLWRLHGGQVLCC